MSNQKPITVRVRDDVKPGLDLAEKAKAVPERRVKGIFKNLELPGMDLRFVWKMNKGEQIAKYHLKDGEMSEVPLSVARHLNDDCWVPVHHYILDDKGNPTKAVGKKKHRFSFSQVDFS